jgi:hypothetical protein
MADPVERRRQVRVQHPPPGRAGALAHLVDGLDRVMAATAGPESIGPRLEPCLPFGLQRVRRQGLQRPVGDHGNPQAAPFPARFRDEHPLDGQGPPRGRAVLQPGSHIGFLPACQHDPPVDPCRLAASVDLRYPPHAHQSARAGPEHQLLQVADPFEVPRLRCREDPLPQTPYGLLGCTPAHSVPARMAILRSVHHHRGVQLAHRFRCPCPSSLSRAHLTASAPFRARASARYPASYPARPAEGQPSCPGFLPPFGHRHSLLGHPVPARDLGLPYGRLTGHHRVAGPGRGFHVPHLRDTTGVGALSTPGTAVLAPAGCRARPSPAASQQPVPAPRNRLPPRGYSSRGINEGSRDSPVRSAPHLWPPDGTGGPRTFPCAPHPAVTSSARQGGAGP